MASPLRPSFEDVIWGLDGCSRCDDEAILWTEFVGQLCARCADDWIERQVAIAQGAQLDRLPAWDAFGDESRMVREQEDARHRRRMRELEGGAPRG